MVMNLAYENEKEMDIQTKIYDLIIKDDKPKAQAIFVFEM